MRFIFYVVWICKFKRFLTAQVYVSNSTVILSSSSRFVTIIFSRNLCCFFGGGGGLSSSLGEGFLTLSEGNSNEPFVIIPISPGFSPVGTEASNVEISALFWP